MEDINKRLAEIATELESPECDVEALETEVTGLEQRKATLVAEAETRAATLDKVAKLQDVEVIEEIENKEERNSMDTNKEYRSAYFKRLLGRELSEEETRAYAQAGVAGAIPTETADEIIKKISKYAPILDEITLLNVKGNVSFAVEGTKTDAAQHTENGTITGDSDTLVTVTLGGYEITKLIQVSKSVETMSVSSFEAWLTDMIAEMVGGKIEDLIINGSGTSTVKGVEKANTWGVTNSVEYDALASTDVLALIGLLPAGYDRNAKILMNKRTLFTSFMPLQDNGKYDIVKMVGTDFFVYGYKVLLSDKVAAGVAFLGDFTKYVGNLAQEVGIVSQFDINTNSNKYLGCAVFDGKPAVAEAFVKLSKSADSE